MKHVSILVPQGHTSVVNIEGTRHIFSEANACLVGQGHGPAFEINLVGLGREVRQATGFFTVNPDRLLQEVTHTDLIIIPALHGDLPQAIARNEAFLPWIVEHYQHGAEVASFCVGAFFLAATGLLHGKQCATHWAHAPAFRRMFPDVHLVDDKILTEEDRIYTSGGAYSYLNLLLHLIEKYAGRELAILIAKMFAIELDRSSQSAFIIFQGQKAHEDEAVRKAQAFIEQHVQDRITVDQLADLLAVGRRSLERRFKKATGNTVTEYIQRVKVEASKKCLETSRKTVNEVMFDVGYNDTKAFRTVFKKITGLSPLEYRNKYNKATMRLAG
ncbi:Transcriptional regulator GlxA family, contains an amidase domain and an AraC-type DNA-binding HTH domain [Catalinimonas alkaloidigena]|uniref:Transcriptional regulator GlxA family, contains an amidase domain and an AraC-type DNA-binding HTH domain n=1 Tax=Catalinimonas alkaloidigena TaxID=1075417 RepID=A0A1G9H0P5_9BACT|nr:helix-turn-helix domain-containing protein [Catalinimonas alkaloidigena]SDL06425.1 Transcriptional regulator GlxA family, contains an amidase domain and an AraC-type DNA-binding HTH domain [Catalinimonas alkaloidigena]